jgi:imidazolonepropionase-like amidohydrolase
MVLLRHCTVIDGHGGAPVDVDIEIRDGMIVNIGKDLPGDDGIDLKGKHVLPGFIDAHVHLMLSGEAESYDYAKHSDEYLTLVSYTNALNSLRAGFTTLCDKGARGGATFALKKAIQNHLVSGPHLLVCGRLICMTGGHGNWLGGREADGVDECRKAAREQLKAGADLLKIMATGGVLTQNSNPNTYQFEIDEMQAIVHEAHKAGVKASAHDLNTQGVINAVQAGVDMIDHASRAEAEAIAMMGKNGSSWVTTISSAAQEVERGPAWIQEKARPNLLGKAKIMAMAKKYDVTVVLGTDAGTPFNPHGANASEFVHLVEYGLTEMESIQAGTKNAAEALGIDAFCGTIDEGKVADLVVVEGDPLSDITVLRDRVNIVMKEGKIVAGI